MPTTAFEYKCRRCGAVYAEPFDELCGPLAWCGGSLRAQIAKPGEHGLPVIGSEPAPILNTHTCPDHGHGISDLIGITPPREEGE